MRGNEIWQVAVASVLTLAAATAAQEASDYGFGEVIDVELVNVEVWVTDKDGVPVSGLTAADFEVFEDGEPVPVAHFAEVAAGRQLVWREDRSGVEPEAAAAEPDVSAVEPGYLVLYFDQLHLVPSSRKQIISDLRDFLASEPVPAQRVLILSQTAELSTEATFGSTWEELDAALGRLLDTAGSGGTVEGDKRLMIRELQDLWKLARELTGLGPSGGGSEAACGYFLPRAVPAVEAYAAKRRHQIGLTLEHLASVSSFLTGVPGVKTLVYVSDLLERAPGTDLVAFMRKLCTTQSDTPLFVLSDELSRAFSQLANHANANRVTIYALETRGLRSSFTAGAEQGSGDFQGLAGLDAIIRDTERAGLSNLAADTGGRAMFDRNTFDAQLASVERDMSSYYSLAYEPPHGGDEGVHAIEVKARNKALRVRHRAGYQDKNADVRMTERLQAAVYLGLVENPLEVRLGAGELRRLEDDWVALPLHLLIPRDKIVFLPGDDGPTALLSVQIATRNTRTHKGVFDQRAFRVAEPADAAQQLVTLKVELELPAGVHLVAIGLRDDASREASFVTTTVEINASEPQPAGR